MGLPCAVPPGPDGRPESPRNHHAYRRKVTRESNAALRRIGPDVHRGANEHGEDEPTVHADRGRLLRRRRRRWHWLTLRRLAARVLWNRDRSSGRRSEQLLVRERRKLLVDLGELLIPVSIRHQLTDSRL